MCKLEKDEVSFFSACGFRILKERNHYLELKAESGQYYCIYKEDEDIIVLLHRHHSKDSWHVHYVFDDSSKCITEILQHERYIKKRNKERDRICQGRKIEIIM